tara:strand:- start:5132 stop:6268 length:1137 start_codon:yes stop_codon:yes gene_type:complete
MEKLLQKNIIQFLQAHIKLLGFRPVIHFELEGCYASNNKDNVATLNFEAVNSLLFSHHIDGELVPEYWTNQWEYVSKFNGQSPLKEAENLAFILKNLPAIFLKQGISKTLIKPVVWSGDRAKLGDRCQNVFSGEQRAVHIPNAIQINVSILNNQNENMVAETAFGDYLQQAFLSSSLSCCLLYLPEEEAFERLALKTQYGLADELCSPVDISGGHQGSIALYKKLGKHNQAMGRKTLLVDRHNDDLLFESRWKETARIEHRLGASSLAYCPYVNVIFALLNIIEALENFTQAKPLIHQPSSISLPNSLASTSDALGAIELFKRSNWFENNINKIQSNYISSEFHPLQFKQYEELPLMAGNKLKKIILAQYQQYQDIIY